MHSLNLASRADRERGAPAVRAPAVEPRDGAGASWWGTTLALGLFGSLLLWLSFPPVDLWPLAWVAPVPWLLIVRRRELRGRRPYVKLWIAGFVFWMAILHWLRLPHWATSFGWVALAAYTGVYLPVFVGLTRVAVHAWHWPLMLAAPVVWTGLELVRAHLLTGYTTASLAHTQYRWLALIQFADLAGAHGIAFLVMFVAACVARTIPCNDTELCAKRKGPSGNPLTLPSPPKGERGYWALWPIVLLVAAMAAALAYGHARISQEHGRPGPRIALIQGSIESEVKADPSKNEVVFREYFDLSRRAVRENSALDLIVWPETMFRRPLITYERDTRPPHGADWTVADLHATAADSRRLIAEVAKALGTPLLLGIDHHHYLAGAVDMYNAAIHVDRTGKILGRYDKMHPVLFGEYVPFGEAFPWLYHVTPLPGGLKAGATPHAFDVSGTRVAPNICFESILPHLIRRQVNELRDSGRTPDILVNLTNDGWYRGSSELDLHLACAPFRAIECRRPFLIAANTGFSASIDATGRIQKQGPRRLADVIVADVQLGSLSSPYLWYGDLPAAICLVICAVLAMAGLWGRMARTAAINAAALRAN